jgi:hypothetical protein
MPCSFLTIQIVFLLLAATSTPVIGNTEDESESTESSFLLKGRHGISVHAGILGGTTVKSNVTVETVKTEVHENAAIASLSYAYWVRRDWNVGVGVGVVDAEAVTSAEAGEVSSEGAAVTSILFGAAYYPVKLAITRSMRPYGSLAIGPYVGSATTSHVGDDVHNESV